MQDSSYADPPSPLAPAAVRYIKLGPGGAWFQRCRDEGLLELGYQQIPHELAAAARWDEAKAQLVEAGALPGKATSYIREVRDFYELGSDCLWVTIAQGHLWWAFAQAEVTPLEGPERGVRCRRAIDGWCNGSLTGEPLTLSTLSTSLTKVAAYQQTICRVSDEAYLLRRINEQEDQAVLTARAAEDALLTAAVPLIQSLDWKDFELLVDLIFANSGWRRTSQVGGSAQADSDILLEQAVTGERAFVQVKSAANAATLNEYVDRFRGFGFDRMWFVCHSPRGELASDAPGVQVWLAKTVAQQAIHAGLFGWLIEKARAR